MTKEELYAHPGWQWCTAEGAELDVLLLGLRTTFREKLEWLEEMDELSGRFKQSRENILSASNGEGTQGEVSNPATVRYPSPAAGAASLNDAKSDPGP